MALLNQAPGRQAGNPGTTFKRAVRRKGNVSLASLRTLEPLTLEAFVNKAISHKVSLLCTDH
jgi:hypothetical protein